MNICLLVNYDLASNLALNHLLGALRQHKVSIFYSDKVGANKATCQQLETLKFFEQDLFKKLIFPAIDKQQTNVSNQPSGLLTFNGIATALDAGFECLNNINLQQGMARLQAAEPDLILSIRFGKILQADAIKIPRLGVLNLHSGLLPQYQGVMATFWAMLNQAKSYGTTLHFIDSSAIDAGPVVAEQELPLDLKHSYLENVLALYQGGCALIAEAINKLEAGKTLSTIPRREQARYFSFPAENDIQAFEKRGMRFIDPGHITKLAQSYQLLA